MAPRHALDDHAGQVSDALAAQQSLWASGFTRRRFIAGAGMVGAAALASQVVTTKAAYSTSGSATGNTMVVLFLRGGADGLRILCPMTDALGAGYLRSREVRPALMLAPGQSRALAGAPGWGLNAALAALLPYWKSGELTLVPAVAVPDLSRSHFQAQQIIECGGSASSSTGWLDRLLSQLGPGTTFRAVSQGYGPPQSMTGSNNPVALASLAGFRFPGWDGIAAQSQTALATLYRGLPGTVPQDVATTLAAIGQAERAQAKARPAGQTHYPDNDLGRGLSDIATLLRDPKIGLQVATVDVGGWDTHTDEVADLDRNLGDLAASLSAFMDDLGPNRRSKVTVAVMTEFGRRVGQNDSGGADHGHGGVMMLLGGGLRGSRVGGRWAKLSATELDQGDVRLHNNAFDVLGEVATHRLGVGSLAKVFPGHTYKPLGLLR